MGLANKLKLEFVLSMNGNFRVYIFFMCDECICMMHSWALSVVKLNISKLFEDYVIQDEARRSGEAQKLEDSM